MDPWPTPDPRPVEGRSPGSARVEVGGESVQRGGRPSISLETERERGRRASRITRPQGRTHPIEHRRASGNLLRAHVGRGSDDGSSGHRRGRLRKLSQSKVGHDHLNVLGQRQVGLQQPIRSQQHDIGRLHVSVNNVSGMGVIERTGHRADDLAGNVQWRQQPKRV